MTTEYTTTIKLAEYMVTKESIPDPKIIGSSRGKELVGVGDNSNTLFYLDHAFVIASSYVLYKGATESAATAMTETTHYTLSKDDGVITLTSAGVTLVATNNIYASYSFNALLLTDTQAQDALNRAGTWIEKRTNTVWTDGTATTPNYTKVTNEAQEGKNAFKPNYSTLKRPMPELTTTVNGVHAIGVTTLTVASTTGFPSSGYLTVGSEKITYSAKGATTFTVTATTAAHTTGDIVYPFVLESSNNNSDTTITWTVLEPEVDYTISKDTGTFHLASTDYNTPYAYAVYPVSATPQRVRMTYIYGNNTIPDDIVRLTLMVAAKDLIHTGVRKKTADGYGTFSIDMVNIDEQWIESTINKYKNIYMSNT